MTERTITVTTPDGEADGCLLLPLDASPCPLVLFFVDAGGIRPSMIEMASHLTGAGYAVLMANPYWRQGPFEPFDTQTVFSVPDERTRLMTMVHAVMPAEWLSDTESLATAIDDPRVQRDRVAMIGFCMGGRTAFIGACSRTNVAAVAPIHAGGLVNDSPESPHRKVDALTAAVYLGVADEDQGCTPEHQATLEAALDAASVRYELELHEGARHGFSVPDFPVYDATVARRTWDKVLTLFTRELPAR
jgi:carboxymethylenebutenolidase